MDQRSPDVPRATAPPGPVREAVAASPRHDYHAFRPASNDFRLISATVKVTLLDDPRRARFEYECHMETTGEVAARYWCYHLPAEATEVRYLRAWDAHGDLQPRLYAGETAGSRMEFRLGRPVVAGERYTFGFEYESSIRPVVIDEGPTCTVTYSDWVIFNIPCAVLHVHVDLPSHAELVASVPASADEAGSRATYRARALRALDTVTFLVAYRRRAATPLLASTQT